MVARVTIGEAARKSGVPVETIRFYEAAGVIPRPARSRAGYRLYSAEEIRRLRLVRGARRLGLSLAPVRALVARAFDAACDQYLDDLLDQLAARREEVERRIAALAALRDEIDAVTDQARHARAHTPAGRRVAQCGRCPLIDDEVRR